MKIEPLPMSHYFVAEQGRSRKVQKHTQARTHTHTHNHTHKHIHNKHQMHTRTPTDIHTHKVTQTHTQTDRCLPKSAATRSLTSQLSHISGSYSSASSVH